MAKLVRLSKADFGRLLRDYDIGTYVSHRHIDWALGNSVYALSTTKGNYILKVHQRIDPAKLAYALKVMESARKKGVPVAEIVRTLSGDLLSRSGGRVMTVQRFVAGSRGGWIRNREMLIDVSRTVGKVSRAMRKLPLHGSDRHIEAKFDSVSWGPKSVYGFDLAGEQARLHEELKCLRRSRLRTNMVHADIHSGNLIYDGNRVAAVLDWEDIHKDLLAYEPAVFISANFISNERVMRGKIRLFISEYQRYVRLNAEEKRALYYLVRHRMLGSLAWLAERKGKGDGGKAGLYMRKLIARYRRFSSISPLEFSRMIDPKASVRRAAVRIVKVRVPEYRVAPGLDYLGIGRKVDSAIERAFPDGDYVYRAIGMRDHPGLPIDRLAAKIVEFGTDRYDPRRKEVCFEDFRMYDHDIHADSFRLRRRKIVLGSSYELPSLFGDTIKQFYEKTPLDRGYRFRIDMLILYRADRLARAKKVGKASGRRSPEVEKCLYKFKDPGRKPEALAGIIEILR